jgi:uncharacterized RDD family membrane protein YckC
MMEGPDWYARPKSELSQAPHVDSLDDMRRVEFATFGVRAAARLLDEVVAMGVVGFVGGIIGVVILTLLSASGLVAAGWQARIRGFSVGSFGFSLVASVLYHAFSEGLGGASLGKAVLGLRVKSEELRPAGVWRGVVRSLAYYFDALFFGLVAYSVMSKSRRVQRLGDNWAGTVVVRAASLSPASRGEAALGILLGCSSGLAITTASWVVKGLWR